MVGYLLSICLSTPLNSFISTVCGLVLIISYLQHASVWSSMISAFHGNPMKKGLHCQPQCPVDLQWENTCHHQTPSVLIGCSWNLHIRLRWIKSQMNLKTGRIGSPYIEGLFLDWRPLDCQIKKSIWFCHQHHNSFSLFGVFFLNLQMIFRNWADLISNHRVKFFWLLNKPPFDFVICVTLLVWIVQSWNLQIRSTSMESDELENQIGSLIVELRPHGCRKSFCLKH